METIFCPWEPATFLFISSNVPLLINYSHFIAIFSALATSLLVFLNNPRNTVSQLFLFFASLFSIWALLDVGLWATNDPGVVMYSWSLQVLIEPLTYATAFFIFFIYLYKKVPSYRYQLFVFALLLPLIVLLPTTFNLEALQLSTCESVEGPLAKYYTYILNVIFTILIVHTGFTAIPKLDPKKRKSAVIFLIGLVTFLLSFTSGNIIGSLTDDWAISQYGLFGMPIFAALIAYGIVRFNTFKIHIAGAQILVVTVWALVCSLLFVETELIKIIAFITLIFTTISGYLLTRSVQHEFEQKQKLEELTKKLAKANKRLRELDKMKSEFVSIASHQLRSPLTSIRGYASMLLDGSYGNITQKAKQAIERIADSSTSMASSVEDYLNVSRIEAGNMKYELVDFDLNEEAEKVADDKRQEAIKHGLLLTFKSKLARHGVVNADLGKTRQILHNLVNNAIKYTQKGSIEISVHDDPRNDLIFVDVIDTGIGMKPEESETIFEKFQRAAGANDVNVTGTGLGLFVAQKMASEMGGTITAHSDGPGKGSTFQLQLPLQK